jgi:hypothetical protein
MIIWFCQAVLFGVGVAAAMLCAQFGAEAIAWTLGIDELVPKAVIFFGSLAIVGLIGNRVWPEHWTGNRLL